MNMKLKITPEYIYCYILILLLVNNWWGDLRVFQGIYQIFKPAVLGLAIITVIALTLVRRYNLIEVLWVLLLVAAGSYTAFLTGNKWILYSMILIAFARTINIHKTIQIIYVCMSIFIIFSVSIFLIQCIFSPDSLSIYQGTSVIKYNMVFTSANEAARYWIFWFALFLYVNAEKKIPILKKLLIFIGTLFFYAATLSDALLLVPATALLVWLGRYKIFQRLVKKYGGYSFVSIWIFSLVILIFHESFFYHIMDRFMTGRLDLGMLGLETYEISLLGQSPLEFYHWLHLDNDTYRRLVVDNAYYMTMLQYGTLYLVLVSFLFIKARSRLNYISSCCLIIYSVFALAENTIFSPTAIFPVIIAAHFSWKPKQERSKHPVRSVAEPL